MNQLFYPFSNSIRERIKFIGNTDSFLAAPLMSNPALASHVFTVADEYYARLVRQLSEPSNQSLAHGEVEQLIQTEGTELLRRLFQSHLDLRYEAEGSQSNVVGSDGEKRPHRRNACQRQLETLFGTVRVTRLGYSSKKSGVSALYPADGQLNLAPDQYSDGVRQRVSETAASVSFSETSQSIGRTTGAWVGKRQCEELTVQVSQDFDDFYAQKPTSEDETGSDLLVLTTDGKGIVMHRADLRDATAKASQKAAQEKKTRLSPGEKGQRKRMATVAAVYGTAPFIRQPEQIIGPDIKPPKRPPIVNKRVWASVEKSAATVIQSAFDEAKRRDPTHQRQWVVLLDGEERQLDYVKASAQHEDVRVTIILDFIHVLEYLWKAAYCFTPVGSVEAETWVMTRALALLQGKSRDVAAGIRRSSTLKDREKADKCADYLLKYRDYLHYDQYLSKGYPIATGVIEGACRHLICDRMDITGARWRLERAEAVLKIRALRSSGDFEDYWTFHKVKEFQRHHQSRFQEPERVLMA